VRLSGSEDALLEMGPEGACEKDPGNWAHVALEVRDREIAKDLCPQEVKSARVHHWSYSHLRIRIV
jgi:hypothetical protein